MDIKSLRCQHTATGSFNPELMESKSSCVLSSGRGFGHFFPENVSLFELKAE